MTRRWRHPGHGRLHVPGASARKTGRQAQRTSGRSAVVLYEMLTGRRALRARGCWTINTSLSVDDGGRDHVPAALVVLQLLPLVSAGLLHSTSLWRSAPTPIRRSDDVCWRSPRTSPSVHVAQEPADGGRAWTAVPPAHRLAPVTARYRDREVVADFLLPQLFQTRSQSTGA